MNGTLYKCLTPQYGTHTGRNLLKNTFGLYATSGFATLQMRYTLFWDVTQRRLERTDVSGQPIRPIFIGQAVPEAYTGTYRRFGTTYPSHLQGSSSPRSVYLYVSTFQDNPSVPSSVVKQSQERRLVRTDVSGQPIRPIFRGHAVPESRTNETSVTTNPRCVTSQKSEDLLFLL